MSLTPELFKCLMSSGHIRTADIISLALANRQGTASFITFKATLGEVRQRGISDLAVALFKSRYHQFGIIYHKLLEISGQCIKSTPFLLELPKHVQYDLYFTTKQCTLSSMYPSDIEVDVLKLKLHPEILTDIWLNVLSYKEIENHCFSDPDDTKYMSILCANPQIKIEDAHNHLSKLTDYMLIVHKDKLNVNDKFMRGLCYWQLYKVILDIGQLAKHYRTHLNLVLPWVLLLSVTHRNIVLVKLSEQFTIEHYAYLHKVLDNDVFSQLCKFWYKAPVFQSYIRQIPIRDNYNFLLFLKQNKLIVFNKNAT